MDPLMIVIVLALGATTLALLLGLISLGSPATNQFASTPLMWARIGFQAFTIVLLLVAVVMQS